jgi:TonB family protein
LTRRHLQLASLGVVLALHTLVIWAISSNAARRISRTDGGEIHMVLARATVAARPAEPPSVELAPIMLQPPEIAIQGDTGPGAMAVVSPADILAPRPDPRHPNKPPRREALGRDAAKMMSALLKILVAEDGSIAAAEVARSCGDASVDNDVVAYVQANWRFLPALLRDKTAIRYWLTVSVQFTA